MTKLLSPYPESRRFLDKSVNLKNLIAIKQNHYFIKTLDNK